MKICLASLALNLVLGFATVGLSQTAPTTPTAPSTNTPGTQNDKNAEEEEDSNRAFWQARFQNGGHYLVKLGNIVSASKHEYIGNGAARVVEVSIGTNTSLVARFYFFEAMGKDTPIAAGAIIMDRAEQLTKQIGTRVSPSLTKLQVVKDYPNTTHSHTVEYAVQSEAVLASLYDSLLKAINTGRGRIWNERGGN